MSSFEDYLPSHESVLILGKDILNVGIDTRLESKKTNFGYLSNVNMVIQHIAGNICNLLNDVIAIQDTLPNRNTFAHSPTLSFAYREIGSNFLDMFYLIENSEHVQRKYDYVLYANACLTDQNSDRTEQLKQEFIAKWGCKNNDIRRWIEKKDSALLENGYNKSKPKFQYKYDDWNHFKELYNNIGHCASSTYMEGALLGKNLCEHVISSDRICFVTALYFSYLVIEIYYKAVFDKILRDDHDFFYRIENIVNNVSIPEDVIKSYKDRLLLNTLDAFLN